MTDDHRECSATPKAELEDHIMNPCTAKNEAEWWASREIERLRKDVKTAIMGDSAELRDAKKEIERLRAAVTRADLGILREMWIRESEK